MSFTTMLFLACLVMLGVTAFAAGAIFDTTRRRNLRSASLDAGAPSAPKAAVGASDAPNQ